MTAPIGGLDQPAELADGVIERAAHTAKAMSALPPKADMCSAPVHVRFGPKADIGRLTAPSQSRLWLVRRADILYKFVVLPAAGIKIVFVAGKLISILSLFQDKGASTARHKQCQPITDYSHVSKKSARSIKFPHKPKSLTTFEEQVRPY
jgi:hypothetical protein